MEASASQAGHHQYILTGKALAALSHGSVISSPTPALVLREHLPLKDRSLLELMDHLVEKEGFEWRRFPTRVADRQSLCFRPDSPEKVWYSSGPEVLREYLLCLLRSAELFELGITSIPHYSTRAAYCKLLAGEKLPPPLALEDDVERDRPAPRRPQRAQRRRRRGLLALPVPAAHAGRERHAVQDGSTGSTSDAEAAGNDTSSEAVARGGSPGNSDHGGQNLEEALAEVMDDVEGKAVADAVSKVPHQDFPPPIATESEDFVMRPNFHWGAVEFMKKKPGPLRSKGGWQIACPYLRKNAMTACTKFVTMPAMTLQCEESVIRCLKQWGLEAPKFDRQSWHLLHPAHPGLLPAEDVVEAALEAGLRSLPKPSPITADTELDAASRTVAARRNRGGGRGRGRPGSSGDPVASRGRGGGRAAVGSSSDDSGSSSTSSSSSSSSTS